MDRAPDTKLSIGLNICAEPSLVTSNFATLHLPHKITYFVVVGLLLRFVDVAGIRDLGLLPSG